MTITLDIPDATLQAYAAVIQDGTGVPGPSDEAQWQIYITQTIIAEYFGEKFGFVA